MPPSHPNTRPGRCRRRLHLTSPMPKTERSQTAAWCCPAPGALRTQQSAPPVPCPTPDLPVTRSGRRGDPSTRGGRRKAPPRTPLPTCCQLCAKTATRMRAAACTGAESRAPMQRAPSCAALVSGRGCAQRRVCKAAALAHAHCRRRRRRAGQRSAESAAAARPRAPRKERAVPAPLRPAAAPASALGRRSRPPGAAAAAADSKSEPAPGTNAASPRRTRRAVMQISPVSPPLSRLTPPPPWAQGPAVGAASEPANPGAGHLGSMQMSRRAI